MRDEASPDDGGATSTPPGRRRRRYAGVVLTASAGALVAVLIASMLLPPPGISAGWRGPVGWAGWLSGHPVGWPTGPITLASAPSRLDFRPTASRNRRPAPPVLITAASAGIEAKVGPSALGPEGMTVPPPDRAGWLDTGPRPGEPGRALLAGHLDTKDGPGAFAGLPGLRRGDLLAVTDAEGAVHRYRTTGKAQMPKTRFPRSAVYGGPGTPELVLVTCGGSFDERTASYRDSIVVFARAE
jgi:hypothetical protein